MRAEDVAEVMALGALTPRAALDLSLSHHGDTWTATFDGEPVAIFGVIPVSILSNAAIAWLLGTDLLVKHWRAFARVSISVLAEVHGRYPVLVNATHTENTLAIRWLRWLGAKVDIHGNEARFLLCAT